MLQHGDEVVGGGVESSFFTAQNDHFGAIGSLDVQIIGGEESADARFFPFDHELYSTALEGYR